MATGQLVDMPTHGLPTDGQVISQTDQLADAASTRFCGYYETAQANEYKNAKKQAYQKLKPTKAFKALVIFNIFTATVSGSIHNLISQWLD